jgi:tetratricopeptide (TPR) repeat protein
LAQLENLDQREQAQQLHTFVFLAIKSGQTEIARRALSAALKLAASQDEDSRDTGFIRAFARIAIEQDDLDLAVRFIDLLDDGSARKAMSLVLLAQARARKGENDQAIALIDQAMKHSESFDEDEQSELVDLLTASVKVLVLLGEKDRAAKLVNQANEFLQASDKPHDADSIQLATSLARIGESSRAMAVVESLDDNGKVAGLGWLAYVYHARGEETAALSSLDRAREILAATSDGQYAQAIALDQIARVYLGMGKPDEAFEVMRGVRYPYYLVKVGVDVANAFAAKGRREDARAALDFAFAQVRNVVSEKSEDIPSSASYSDAKMKSHGLSDLAEKYLEIGDVGGAEAAARAIDQPQYQAQLLARVALACAKQGDQFKAGLLLARAFKVSSKSQEYNHDSRREEALLKIAEAYAEAGFKNESANVVLRLLRELLSDDNRGGTIEYLIEIDLITKAKGVPINRSIQSVLKQVVKKEETN